MSARAFDVAVVGGGTAGITAALAARHEGARVVLVERASRLGGECAFFGCVPSKALVETARFAHDLRRAVEAGILAELPPLDFRSICARRARIVEEIAHDERDERCTSVGIEVFHAAARFTGPYELDAGGRLIQADRFVVALGTKPFVPPLPGLDSVPYMTNETLFSLEHLPRRLLILGAGPTGLELAQAFRRFGSEVAVVERLPEILQSEEPEAAAAALRALGRDGVELHLGVEVTAAERRGDDVVLRWDGGEASGDALLVATGRLAATGGLGLERAGVELDRGFVRVDARLRTSAEHVYAAGDVTGGLLFTHVAAHEGRVAGVNAAGGKAEIDERAVPSVVYLDPEIARIGVTEAEARQRLSGVEVATWPMSKVDRARIDERTDGFVKLVTARRRLLGRLGGGVLVGAQIVGPHAGELVHEAALAIQGRAFAGRLAQTIHAYPSASMALQQAAAQLFPLGRALAEREL